MRCLRFFATTGAAFRGSGSSCAMWAGAAMRREVPFAHGACVKALPLPLPVSLASCVVLQRPMDPLQELVESVLRDEAVPVANYNVEEQEGMRLDNLIRKVIWVGLGRSSCVTNFTSRCLAPKKDEQAQAQQNA